MCLPEKAKPQLNGRGLLATMQNHKLFDEDVAEHHLHPQWGRKVLHMADFALYVATAAGLCTIVRFGLDYGPRLRVRFKGTFLPIPVDL